MRPSQPVLTVGTEDRTNIKKVLPLLAAVTFIGCLMWSLTFDFPSAIPVSKIREVWFEKLPIETTTLAPPTVRPRKMTKINFREIIKFLNFKENKCDKILDGKRTNLPFEFNSNNRFFERTLKELSSFHKVPIPEVNSVIRFVIYKIAHEKFIQTICDANFDIGRRALVILSTIQLPTILYSFDAMTGFPLTFRMYPYLLNKFRRHFKPVRNLEEYKYFLQQERRCDMLVLGGTSNANKAKHQMTQGKEIANYLGHVLIWELTKESTVVWNAALKSSQVKEHFRCSFIKNNQIGFVIGEYLSPA